MGGHDPYSASKGAAEIAIAAWRRSFFLPGGSPVKLASARAGNVIGGGDWAEDRIVPDCMRALRGGRVVAVRNRHSTRPWQHVLEPLSGYLQLAAEMQRAVDMGDVGALGRLCGAFNFGPSLVSNRTVMELVAEVCRHTGGEWEDASDPRAPHEAGKLNLSTDRAFHLLGWRPVWDFGATVGATAGWYLGEMAGGDAGDLTRRQLDAYVADARAAGVPWAV